MLMPDKVDLKAKKNTKQWKDLKMINGSVHKEYMVSEFVSLITSQKYSKISWLN